MKQLLSILTLIACISSAFGADIRHYSLKFDEFHELKVVDGINVTYKCEPSRAGEIEFDADASVASAVIFTPGKGKLSISLASRDSAYSNLPTVTVYSSFLSSVRNEGDSTVRVLAPAAVPKLTAKLIGNGHLVVRDCKCTEINASIISGHGVIMLTGEATTAKLSVTGGSADIQADDLRATEVSASINGTGAIACYPTKNLTYSGIGSGKISYRGNPTLKKKPLTTVKINSIDSIPSK